MVKIIDNCCISGAKCPRSDDVGHGGGRKSSGWEPLLGTWGGTYQNSKNQTGTSRISFTKGADGKITGNEDGVPINDVTLTGSVIKWKYKASACRTYEGSLTINPDGRTATGSYTAIGCNDEYTGKYIDYKKQ